MQSFAGFERWRIVTAALASLVALAGGGSDSGDGQTSSSTIHPANFVAQITNRYFPLTPGTTFNYSIQKDGATQLVAVSSANS